MNTLKVLAAVATALMLSGCKTIRPQDAGPPPVAHDIAFRRIVIVEFYNRTPYGRSAEQFAGQLREKLAEWTTSTDVQVVARSSVPDLGDPFVSGTMPVAALVDLRRRHRADAVILGSIDDHNPYPKPWVHISLKVIDTANAETPFQMSESWNANHQAVRDEIDSYYRRNYGQDDCRFGPDLFVIAPTYFLRFVADRIAEQLATSL